MQEDAEKILPVSQSIPYDALAGFRVVEMTNYVAAPICGRMLGDYGAEVIKIEHGAGDAWRVIGKNTKYGATENDNPMFDVLNSGKKSVVLDLKDPKEREKLFKLLETADVFLTNGRMKSLKKMGLDPETVRAKFPALVYALITGYGIDGPEKDDPGFDSVAFWARSGFLMDVPYAESGLPMSVPTGVGDSTCGVVMLSGILAALLKRARTGKGDFVTTSLLASGIWVNNNMVIMAQPKRGEVFPMRWEDSAANACAYRCADGEWLLLGFLDYKRYMPVMLDILGIPELINDPKFKDQPSARKNMKELLHKFEAILATKTCEEWLALMKPRDIVCCRLPHYRDVATDQQAWANGNLEEFTLGNGDTCVLPCPPVRFGSAGVSRSVPGPLLGEHTEEILNSL